MCIDTFAKMHTRTNRYGIIVRTRLVFDDLMRMFAAWMQSWLRALSLQVTTVMTCESWQFSFCYLVRHWWVDACFEYIQLLLYYLYLRLLALFLSFILWDSYWNSWLCIFAINRWGRHSFSPKDHQLSVVSINNQTILYIFFLIS